MNVSTPDHMHAADRHAGDARAGCTSTARSRSRRRSTRPGSSPRSRPEKKLVTQMGIQIHSHRGPQARRPADPGRGHRQGEGGPLLERQGVGRPGPAAGPQGPGAGEPRLGPVARGGGRAAVHRRRVLPPRQLAQAARLRHRHLRRHGLPHPRPGVRRAGRRQPEVGPLRAGGPRTTTTGRSTCRWSTSSPARSTRPRR